MKKVLMGTSAIALVSAVSTQAQAVEWDVDVGGFSSQHIAYASVDIDGEAPGTDFDGVDVLSNTEIIFAPSITLDNGLKFGANVQLEGNTSGDTIDESYVFIRGSFGEINIGSENSAGYKMTYAAPNVTAMPINSGSISAYIPISGGGGVSGLSGLFRNAKGSSFVEVGANNDAQRITYYTPRFAGFQLGASYARDASQDSSIAGDDLNGAAFSNIFDIGANYVNSFGGFDVAVSGRWGIANNDTDFGDSLDTDDNPQVFAAGINLGFAGATIGYAFAESNNSGGLDSQGHSAGISYETGPWGVSATYYRGEGVNTDAPASRVLKNRETYQAVVVGGAYTLAKGVKFSVYGAYAESDEDTNGFDANGDGDFDDAFDEFFDGGSIDGFVIGTAISLSF